MITLYIIIGLLIVGLFARFVWPREETGDFIMVLAFGIAGAATAGFIFLLLWHFTVGDTKVPQIIFLVSMAAFLAICLKAINYLWRRIRIIRWRLRKWL